ncbi:DNA modification methylase [Candidatus Peregrinibacteria bacterium]|nr:MAG: DNA modification methylase [Candidatus Peregrinibacteria bacterium]
MDNPKSVLVPIKNLNPSPYNPRKINPEAFEQIKESIKRFGLLGPIIVNNAPNRKNIVIGGHQRMRAAIELGFDQIPVLYVNIPDEDRERELNIRLNKNTGEWNFDLLREFDLDLLTDVGFSPEDLQNLWDDVFETEDDDFDIEEELKTIKEVFVKEGDFYQLGQHVLACGDSTDPNTVKKLVGDKKVHLISGDPPYNIGLSYDKGIGGTKSKYGGTKVNDNKSDEAYRAFLKKTLENALTVSQSDTHIFYWCDERYIWILQTLYAELGVKSQRVCFWIKNSAMVTPQIAFNKTIEPVIYGTRGKPFLSSYHTSFTEIMNKEVGTGNRAHDDVLDLLDIWLEKRLPSASYSHPTEKSPTIYERMLRRCTKPGDYVLELFGGSGSIMAACQQMNRRCLLIELDPLFASLIIRRYEKLTNQKALKLN